jgi:hypothetical protein
MVIDLPGVDRNFGGQTGPAWISWVSGQLMPQPIIPDISLLNDPVRGRFHVNMAPISRINNPANPWYIDPSSIAFNGNNVSFRMPNAERVLVGPSQGAGQWPSAFAFAISFREGRFTPASNLLDPANPAHLQAATYATMPYNLSNYQRNVVAEAGVVSGRFTFPTYNRGTVAGSGNPGWVSPNCRDYRSPLVLFFDHRRPEFSARARFKMHEIEQTYSWPEAGSPGSFLALDRNRDGKITSGEELFGDSPVKGVANGFDALSQYDSNKDGVIDAKDPVWNELVLWQDHNADARGSGKELTALKNSPVESISLRYVSGRTEIFGPGVEGREFSSFRFVDEDGMKRQGQIIDLYFEQQPNQLQMAQK